MKPIFTETTAFFFLVYVFIFCMCSYTYNKETSKWNSYLGKEEVIRGDTLVITSGHWTTGDFHLNNGAIVDENIIDNYLVK